LFIELGMFLSHGIWLLRTRQLRKEAKTVGMTFDEYPEAVKWQEKGIKLSKIVPFGSKKQAKKEANIAASGGGHDVV
ncbi:hypothetical protein LTS18_001701, partial [Coniosporium uncinatum]